MLFSSGKILQIKDDKMVHSSSTSSGSSGSPLIRRNRNRNELNYIVGIHFGTLKDYNYNLAASFDNILNDLKNKIIIKKDYLFMWKCRKRLWIEIR